MRRHPLVLATITPLLMLALAACGSSGSGDKVASAGSKAPGSSASAATSGDDSGVKYTQCMREHGVNLPDPEPGKPPQVVNGAAGSALNKAYEACKGLLPKQATEDAKISPEDLDKIRQYAKCMRDNGVDMPDPDPDGGIKAKAGQPKMEAADKVCQSKLPGNQR
jgi:hypothetical protein